TGSDASARRRISEASVSSGPGGRSRSQARSSASQETALAPTAAAAIVARGRDTSGTPGWETIVATSGIRQSGEEGLIRNAILIAGPTASGKSALALALARRLGGRIVNTDSMQAYSVLRVITARPSDEELVRAPHLLYGHVHPGT